MKLWYETSSKNWNEALPIGNGHIGGMIFGSASRECIQLNDETIWYRGKTDRNNKDSLVYLDRIRKYLLNNEVKKAEELVKWTMFATPRDQSHYELLGELYIEHTDLDADDIVNYRRELDLSTALSKVEFESKETQSKYTREYFTSFNQNILCCRISSSKLNGLNLDINLGRNKRFNDSVKKLRENSIVMSASAGGRNGTHFEVACTVNSVDGEVVVLGETIIVRNSTEIVIYVKSISNYWKDIDADEKMIEFINLSKIDYFKEKEEHLKKYRVQFNRIDFSLEYSDCCLQIPTNMLIENAFENSEYLTTLLFHYGRYLLISSSQPNGLPANLQGIWCDELNPIWGSKYTININTQMNYWLTGPCDLPEIEYPLFELLNRMREQGRETAKIMYGARGFTAHHNTDGFGDTAPQSHAMGAAIWVLTVPWLCTHIWEHYQFFRDKKIIRKYFDLVQEAFLFFEDYLFEVDGYLMTGPTVSPENKYRLASGVEANVCLSSTIDNQILRYFCDSCIGIATELEDKSDFIDRVHALRSKLPKTKIGRYGQIQEWFEDYEEVELGHRHISPLFGLYPYNEIDVNRTPELANAAKVTIQRRLSNAKFLDQEEREKAINNWLDSGLHASTQTGWSAAWLIHFFARLQDGNSANKQIIGLLENSTLGNLFLDHPPFQIDGNLGLVSGICEMLVQSHNDTLIILPSLPKSWGSGKVNGFRVRGGYRVSFKWTKGKIEYIKIEGGNAGETIKVQIFDYSSDTSNVISLEFDLRKVIDYRCG